MRLLVITLAAVALLGVEAGSATAQPLQAYGAFSISGDLNDSMLPGASGGVLYDLGALVSAGVQGDLLVSGGYAAGRIVPFAQVNAIRERSVTVFVTGGIGIGEQKGPMYGGGVELWTGRRIGVRAAVQDYLTRVASMDCGFFGIDAATCAGQYHGGRAYTAHQPTVQIGVAWRF